VYSLLLEDLMAMGTLILLPQSITGDLVSVLKNNGNGTFAAPAGYDAGGPPWGSCAADVER